MRSTRLFGLRRVVWRVRRSPPRLARPLSLLLPAVPPPARPILVIGCPRSGTTMLLQALLASPELESVQSEGHILWDEFRHPRDHGWDSDARSAEQIGDRERAYVNLAIRLVVRRRRFVDKTPENCLRVGYLDALFPDATFVFLHRSAAENVNSLMEGWRARPRFVKYRLPETLDGLGALSGDRWSFVLVPGWRSLCHASLEEICARQYVACNEAVLAARAGIDPARWIDLAYEDLVAAPGSVLRELYGRLGLRFTEEAATFAASLAEKPSRTSISAPRAGKWRDDNLEAVERVLPLVEDVERRLGHTSR
jgi:hypothetical protein